MNPNMDEVVRQVKVLLETIDAENGRISLAPAEARLLIEEREQMKEAFKQLHESASRVENDMTDETNTMLNTIKSMNSVEEIRKYIDRALLHVNALN